MSRLAYQFIISLLVFASFNNSALGESSLRFPAETLGTRQVMKVLRHVNLSYNDQKALQGLQDIFDAKSQLYRQDSLLTPINTTNSVSGRIPSAPAQRGPEGYYRKFYRR